MTDMLEAEQEYVAYAGFMAGVAAYALSAKDQYDPLRVFLSSKIDPLPYQIYDFNRLMEDLRTQGSIRALIAYETGLGKTILAGMVLQELVAVLSQLYPVRILVLTPPGVVAQFHDELKEKFDIDLDVFDSQEGRISDRTIASIDTLKFSPWQDHLRHQEWDLVLLDELHRVSPDNLRGEFVSLISGRTQHLLALTATPHDGKSERYEFRLKLISETPLIIRRTKREALDINSRPLFDQEVLESTEEFEVTPAEKAFYRAAEEYARERFKGSPTGALVAITIGRAVSSSIRAGVKMLARRYARLLVEGPEASPELVEQARERMEEGGELSEADIDAILSAEALSPEERQAELHLLEPVLEMGRQLIKDQPIDSKGKYFLEKVDDWLSGGRKCLVFTGFLETVSYLCEMLEERGYRPKEITSRVSLEDRKRVVNQLGHADGPRIIVGTDAMGESLNLQAASVEVNYEVPWSPVAYIQRVGRIWRLGQKEKCLSIHNFLPAFKVERRVLEVVLEKVRTINDEFGEIGLSVFSSELGRVERLIHQEYREEEVEDKVEAAFRRTQYVGRQVLDVLNSSMTLPRVVNLEELQRGAHINFDDTFSEGDLRSFLMYLRDTGYASGHLPEGESDLSSYHVHCEGEYIAVKRPSLHDPGVQAAIRVAKDLLERSDTVAFSYHKRMVGELVLYQVTVNGKTVYEEPVIETPEGVLNYDGITALQPHYISAQANVVFIPLANFIQRRKDEWRERKLRLWESKKADIERQLLEAKYKNEAKQGLLQIALREHQEEIPRDVEVLRVRTICEVEFEQTESEASWLERHEVEQRAMEEAMKYYKDRGYDVDDVSKENRGYDVLCRLSNEVLRVEVKGILGASHPILTEKERRTAVQFREGFVLFIFDMGQEPELKFIIPDPIENLTLTPHQKTEYSVTGYAAFEVEE